jgi:hypothetical protein
MVPTNSNMVLARRVTAGAGASKKAHATTLTPVGFMNNFHLTAYSNLNYDTHHSLQAIYRAIGDMIFSGIPSFHTPTNDICVSHQLQLAFVMSGFKKAIITSWNLALCTGVESPPPSFNDTSRTPPRYDNLPLPDYEL